MAFATITDRSYTLNPAIFAAGVKLVKHRRQAVTIASDKLGIKALTKIAALHQQL